MLLIYSFYLPFWIELKPLGASRSPLIVRVDPNFVYVEEGLPARLLLQVKISVPMAHSGS
jgi:hypothetical protein